MMLGAKRIFLAIAMCVLATAGAMAPARAARPYYTFDDSQLMVEVENVSRSFARHLDRIVFSEGFMRLESREALNRMAKWLQENKYPLIKEFLDALTLEDARTLFEVFKKGEQVGSDGFLPVIEASSATGQSTALSLPFRGDYYVVQGNRGSISHIVGTSNEYAWDFVVMRDGQMQKGASHKNENYYAWGLPAVSPAPGTVVKAQNGQPDHRPLTTDMKGANFVAVRHENDEVSLVYHLMNGSVGVSPGDRVERGGELGKVGNSGISMFPHIHYQFDRGIDEKRKTGPAVFACYFARVEGESDWALVVSGSPQLKQHVINVDDYLRDIE
ncbi:MAG TPA: M23 family metallopeptidase [bacterium]|nr:M23 family metallopeptidase [bacterium]